MRASKLSAHVVICLQLLGYIFVDECMGIKCYFCVDVSASLPDPSSTIGLPFGSSNVNCGARKKVAALDCGPDYSACSKHVTFAGGFTRTGAKFDIVRRNCQKERKLFLTKLTNTTTDTFCSSHSSNGDPSPGFKHITCYCTTDFCNDAFSSLYVQSTLIFVFPVVTAMILRICML